MHFWNIGIKDPMNVFRAILLSIFSISFLVVLASCGSTATQIAAQPTVTINPSFQTQQSPIPTVPPFRCGAWASNNAPGAYSTITIYARLTHDIAPVSGATAAAVVHFQTFD